MQRNKIILGLLFIGLVVSSIPTNAYFIEDLFIFDTISGHMDDPTTMIDDFRGYYNTTDGTNTGLNIYSNSSTNQKTHLVRESDTNQHIDDYYTMNDSLLTNWNYDYFTREENDPCDFTEDTEYDSAGATGDNITIVDGTLQMRTFAGDGNWYIAFVIGDLDTLLYDSLQIRVKTNETLAIRVLWDHSSTYTLTEWYNYDSESEWETLTFDLSSDLDWNDQHTHLDFYFYDENYGSFEGDEFVWFDFVKIQGNHTYYSNNTLDNFSLIL